MKKRERDRNMADRRKRKNCQLSTSTDDNDDDSDDDILHPKTEIQLVAIKSDETECQTTGSENESTNNLTNTACEYQNIVQS